MSDITERRSEFVYEAARLAAIAANAPIIPANSRREDEMKPCKECDEQARLLGMSAEREADLLGRF